MTAPMQMVPRDMPAPTAAARVTARFLACAASQINYREGRDSNGDWNNDNAFGAYFKQNRVSWCHWFASWAAVAAGIPASVIPRTGYTPTGWGFFTSKGRDVTTPRAGDLFYVYGYVPSEGQNRVHHVGIVEKVLSGGRIQTIEGNTNTSGSSQGNGVYRLTRTVTSKLRFARPNYAAAVQTATPDKPVTPPKPIPVKPNVPEDNMPLTEAEWTRLGKLIYAKDEEYGGNLWAAPSGTGTHFIANTKAGFAALTTQVAGLTAAVKALAESQDLDPAAIVAAVEAATEKAMADLKITLTVDSDPATPEA